MYVAVFNEDLETLLGSSGRGACNIDAGHVCLHGFLVVFRGALSGKDGDAGFPQQGAVVFVPDEQQDVINNKLDGGIRVDALEHGCHRSDFNEVRPEMGMHMPFFDKCRQLRAYPVLHSLMQVAAPVAQMHLGTSPPASQGGFASRVATSNNQDSSAVVLEGITQIMADMWELLTGYVESSDLAGATGSNDDIRCLKGGELSRSRPRFYPEAIFKPFDALNLMKGTHVEFVRGNDTSQVGKVFLPRGLLLAEGGNRDSGYRKPVWRRKEACGRGELGGDRGSDWTGFDDASLQPGLLEC